MFTTNVRQSLLNAFNQKNRVKPAIQPSDVIFLSPEIFLDGDCNSRVTFVASTNSENFIGQQSVSYNRRRLSDDLKGIKLPGKPGDYTTLYQVIAVLRDHLGVALMESEFLDRSISGDTVTIDTTVACMGYLPADSVTLEYAD